MTEGLRVNFSEKEAASAPREVLPRGKYHVKITDVELRFSKSEKNNGKPYWAVEFTVQEGPHAERKIWTNAMLFEGALYTFSQLMKALGFDVSSGEFTVPDPNTLIGQDVVVRLKIVPPEGQYDEKNEVSGIEAFGKDTKPGASGGGKTNALLP